MQREILFEHAVINQAVDPIGMIFSGLEPGLNQDLVHHANALAPREEVDVVIVVEVAKGRQTS